MSKYTTKVFLLVCSKTQSWCRSREEVIGSGAAYLKPLGVGSTQAHKENPDGCVFLA